MLMGYMIRGLNYRMPWDVPAVSIIFVPKFLPKFPKSLPESSTGAKKMLNLLTGQVTHQVSAASDSHTGPIRLVELVQNSLKKSIHSIITPK